MRQEDDQIRSSPRIALVLSDGALLSSFGAMIDLVQASKRFVIDQYGFVDMVEERSFDVITLDVLGSREKVVRLANGQSWTTDGIVGGGLRYDGIFLSGFETTEKLEIERPWPWGPQFKDWLRSQYSAGAYIGASGAACFALADAGLLNGRKATTCWWLHRRLREKFPMIRMDRDNALTEDERLLCSAGLAADQALILRLFERVVASHLSLFLSRAFGIERDPLNFASAALTATHYSPDQLVSRAEHWLQHHYSRPVRINDLAADMAVSRRTLIRHFAAALNMTPLDYLHALRMSDARLLLVRSNFDVGRISTLVGYSDVKYFKRLFATKVGMSPKEYRLTQRRRLPIEGPN